MRYFAEISYFGLHYHGWQIQPGTVTVQETIQQKLGTILRSPVNITGCGRTDTGVHAEGYVFHFDHDEPVNSDNLQYRLNAVLPHDISVHRIKAMTPDAHARFSAISRSYRYLISPVKDPFRQGAYWWYAAAADLDPAVLNETAKLLLRYDDYITFCKSHSGADHTRCRVSSTEWIVDDNQNKLIFQITANRFLRGMVRLIVGCCILVARHQLSLDEVEYAMKNKTTLPKNWSVPADGLYLRSIVYPEALNF